MAFKRGSKEEPYAFPRSTVYAVETQVPLGEFYRAFQDACASYHLANLVHIKNWPRRLPPGDSFFPEAAKSPEAMASEPSETTLERTLVLDTNTMAEEFPDSWVLARRDVKVPRLFLELEQPDNGDSAVRVIIRDWELDTRMLDVLNSSCNQLDRLHALNLWNARITEKTLPILINFLNAYSNIRELHFDNNPLPGETFHLLLQEPLQGAMQIAKELGDIQRSNTSLIALNLTGNCIGDDGAKAFASALRMNRSLVTLSFAGNAIGDDGVKALAEALSMARLTVEEKKLRMNILYDTIMANLLADKAAAFLVEEQQPIARVRKSSLGDPKNNVDKKLKAGKDPGKGKEEKKVESLPEGSAMKKPVSVRVEADPSSRKIDDVGSPASILIHYVRKNKEGITCLEGNLSLINLNLAMNKIGNVGIRALWKAVVYQQQEALPNSKHGPGLKRMRLEGNLVRENDANYLKLLVLLKSLDPLFKYLQTLSEQTSATKDDDVQSNWSEETRADKGTETTNISTVAQQPKKKKGK